MATTLRQELIKLALSENENSSIAKILAYYYPSLNFSDKKKLFESLMYYYRVPTDFDFDKLQKETEGENTTEKYRNADYRIKSIEISNLRGIPEQSDYPFGINFLKNSTLNNAIILANNGTGKSSVFAGLEMIFAQEIGEKNLRVTNPNNLGQSDYNSYLSRLQSSNRPKCEIKTNAGEFNLDKPIFAAKELAQFNPSNHFISDYDIYHHGQINFTGNADDDNSFHYLLAKSLGLGDFIGFESSLNEIANYRRSTESGVLNKLESEQKNSIGNIKLWNEQLQERTELLESLKKNKQKTSDAVLNANKSSLIKRLVDKYISFEVDEDEYRKALESFISKYQKNQSQENDDNLSLEKDFLEIGMSLMNSHDNCPFCQDSNKTSDEIRTGTTTRFEQLKGQLRDRDELIDAYKLVVEQINHFFQQTLSLYNIVSEERGILVTYPELAEIFKIEEYIYTTYSPFLADDEFFEYLSKFITSFPQNENFTTLFRFIDVYKSMISDFALQVIPYFKSFITQRQFTLKRILESLASADSENSIEKQIGIVEEEIKRLNTQLSNSRMRVEELGKEITQAKQSADLVKRIKDEAKELLPKYKLIANNLVKDAFDPIKDMISTIMSDFLKEDKDISLSIETKETRKIIEGEEKVESLIVANIQYIDTDTGELKTVSPSHYFNTFRYKLFCLMVSLSLALSTRKKYGINLPLVMDDLFYASDFVSKHRFSKFISKVIELFYKYTPELPLQFILFTHDDLIFRNAIDALNRNAIAIEIEKLCEENREPLLKKTIIGRIFNITENKTLNTILIGDNQSIYNLVYELPQEILNN